jgi:hypothetical protein
MKFTAAILALLIGAASLSAFAIGSRPKPVSKPTVTISTMPGPAR